MLIEIVFPSVLIELLRGNGDDFIMKLLTLLGAIYRSNF